MKKKDKIYFVINHGTTAVTNYKYFTIDTVIESLQ